MIPQMWEFPRKCFCRSHIKTYVLSKDREESSAAGRIFWIYYLQAELQLSLLNDDEIAKNEGNCLRFCFFYDFIYFCQPDI